MHDLIIKGGTVVDGTGADPRVTSIAVDAGLVTNVDVAPTASARRVVDAEGLLVTPGFVDIHTHYDGQVTWDPLLTPSFWHGVTTVVMGNCGVGFAPVRPDRREWLVGVMEGVEDIPGTALHDGIQWNWESFPEYLDYLDTQERALDVGTQVPHGAVRAYVMGERGARNEPATPEDIKAMAAIVREGIVAGALAFSMSRTMAHRAIDGEPVPGTFAAEDEIFGICSVLQDLDTGVIELAPAGVTGDDLAAPAREVDWMRRLSAATGRPVTFALLQHEFDPSAWREMLTASVDAAAQGAALYPQVAGRSVTSLLGLQASVHPFSFLPSYEAIADLPLADRVAAMRQPDMRTRLLDEARTPPRHPLAGLLDRLDRFFFIGDPPNYEPERSASVVAIAEREGRPVLEVIYDGLLRNDGRELLMVPLINYHDFNLDSVHEMLLHPNSVLGLGDGGAHCGVICDASIQTFMLTHWARDRARDRLPLEFAVKKMTLDTASLYGLHDRGALVEGRRADLNLIDFDNLALRPPQVAHDLPSGAKRLIQRADGLVGTFVAGEQVADHGEDTGARPGRLIRGERGTSI